VKPTLALLGLDQRVLLIGQRAVEHNIELAGIWSSDHNSALTASLKLGCCAFPRAAEPLSQAHWVVYSETDGPLPANLRALNVAGLQIINDRFSGRELSEEWRKWLADLGFDTLAD